MNTTSKVANIDIGTLLLDSREELPAVTLTYEQVGTKQAPVILVCHALTGNHIAVGTHEAPGWWSGLIGNHLSIDTTKFQVITFNVLGGCDGSTGPLSINPITNKPYRSDFPKITVRDIVRAQQIALKQLGIDSLYAVIGGSLGGMQAMEWGLLYPNMVERLILLAATPYLSDYGIAYNYIAERSIKSDPLWQSGHYDSSNHLKGLEIARMIGMVTYRSPKLFEERFRREITDKGYEVTSYLQYQGEKLVKRFDANSYLYLLDAMNTHDIGRDRGGWENATTLYRSPVLAISYEEDLIYEPTSISVFASLIPHCTYHHIDTRFGHDGFLTEYEKWGNKIASFLTKRAI
ncbi:homoserine O-acetyltransferase MetX [Ornithinibacillus sp. 179-J 7C1 HS]|uniref:homoserine O-acetyltransferase MetX n=1 Tax=Ornithinibacillus sp. 179-J 7C1 HS TaxID=3142384 RepID=UPI0039A3517B